MRKSGKLFSLKTLESRRGQMLARAPRPLVILSESAKVSNAEIVVAVVALVARGADTRRTRGAASPRAQLDARGHRLGHSGLGELVGRALLVRARARLAALARERARTGHERRLSADLVQHALELDLERRIPQQLGATALHRSRTARSSAAISLPLRAVSALSRGLRSCNRSINGELRAREGRRRCREERARARAMCVSRTHPPERCAGS